MKKHFILSVILYLAYLGNHPVSAQIRQERTDDEPEKTNLIANGDFAQGPLNVLPPHWDMVVARPVLAPVFKMTEKQGERFLLAAGNGNPDCVGYVKTKAVIELGKTYQFSVKFQFSEDLNPQENLLFQCFHTGARNGIFNFKKWDNNWASGEEKIFYPGEGKDTAEVRILYRLNPDARVWIKEISLTETDPVKPNWVTVACTQGRADLIGWEKVLDKAGQQGVDLALLPEYMQGQVEEPLEGPSFDLMSKKAKQYNMYVAGGIIRKDGRNDRIYNTAMLFGRKGEFIGMYDKIHPYSPELNERGITPGSQVPVFTTDFGKIGIMICYDSWFTDVIQLLALKGAALVLFPNAGYYRSLLPARAADNGLRIVCSTLNNEYGIWDTAGRDVLNPGVDPSVKPINGITFKNVIQTEAGEIKILIASLDLSISPSPHYNGGTMFSAPAGRRNRQDQKFYLEDEIKRERKRWWTTSETKF
jgi:predicted amidohydrolase